MRAAEATPIELDDDWAKEVPAGGGPKRALEHSDDGVPCAVPARGSIEQSGASRRTFARLPTGDGSETWRPLDKRARLVTGKRVPGTRYRLIRWLGEGGMGEVFEAIHVDIERPVALKVLKRGADDALRHHFITEARTIAQIESRFVVDVLDFGELPDGRPFYAMELLQNESLHSLMRRDGRLSLERALPILRQLCKAMTAIHEAGLAHRDLKPENVLLELEAGRHDMVRVVDFGISDEFGPRARQIAGTPMYMAPEQILGEAFDGRLDIYALGCLAYEMLSGEPPFAGTTHELFNQHIDAPPDSLTGRWPDLPGELDDLLGRCLAKQPEDRWPNAVELEAALCELQIIAGFTTPWDDLALPEVEPERRDRIAAEMPRPQREVGRRRKLAGGLGLAVVLAGAAILAWPSAEAEPDGGAVVDAGAWVEAYANDARAAAARAYWVYPPSDEPEFKTARSWVLAIEDRAELSDYAAWTQAKALRSEFAATLVRLGDRYWEMENGRPFAVEYYMQALLFEPEHERASERVALTPAQLADVGARAERDEFSEAELANGEMLAALAETDEKARRKRIVGLLEDEPRRPYAAQTINHAASLVGAEEFAAEVADAVEAAVKSDEPDAPESRVTDARRAQELARQGRLALAKGKRDRAERLFHKAIESDGRNHDAISGLAELHFDRGNYGKALTYAKKATKLQPRDAKLRILLGDVYLKVLRYPDARAAYQKAGELGSGLASKRIARLNQLTQ
ncbi:Serine/threonine-protein kinase PknH [Enhygromyxa salina]|uniref:Serine/threonine-protein kinase PknH n=1 Tax=Enhygromyxa salina TaxID=215803 RepID=A0A2S9XEG0_9BACT|nr:serine/threonine-protein kinase [Enhygromyxa salina]PRP91237.1 Serine/threonine-protein kinase PknH [Enhygromyxa salina]